MAIDSYGKLSIYMDISGYIFCHLCWMLSPGAHGEDLAEQISTSGTFFNKILTVCGQFLLRNCSFVVVRKIISMFDNFCHE